MAEEAQAIKEEEAPKPRPCTPADEIYSDPNWGKLSNMVNEFDAFKEAKSPDSMYYSEAMKELGKAMLEIGFSNEYKLRQAHLGETVRFHDAFLQKGKGDDKPPATFTTYGFDFDEKEPGCCDWQPPEEESGSP